MLGGLIGLAVIALGLGSAGFGLRRTTGDYQRRREVRRAQLWSIAELPEVTIGRIVGVAKELEGTVIAPLSGTRCLYYLICVYGSSYGLGGRARDQVLAEESAGVAFLLDDGADVAVIDPTNATATLAFDLTGIPPAGENPALDALLRRHRVGLDKTSVQVCEAIVKPGDTIAIVGFGVRERGRLTMSSSPKFPLIIANDRKDTRRTIPNARVV